MSWCPEIRPCNCYCRGSLARFTRIIDFSDNTIGRNTTNDLHSAVDFRKPLLEAPYVKDKKMLLVACARTGIAAEQIRGHCRIISSGCSKRLNKASCVQARRFDYCGVRM